MSAHREYRKKSESVVAAVQLNLNTEGFVYHKWGGEQRCRAGDWIVNSEGDTYTVSRESFAATYRQVSPGLYEKVTSVWAEQASGPGTVKEQGRRDSLRSR